jgi:glycosyltransferase involved in cell wall biosynthesis
VRLAIVTPMVDTSAVGRVMAAGAAELARRHDVELWCPSIPPRMRTTLPLRDFEDATPALARALAELDLAVFAIGDSPWHAEILRLAQAVPGLIVLHDVSVANLVTGLWTREGRTHELGGEVDAWYGPEVADEFMSALSTPGQAWLEVCSRAPLVEAVLAGSLGVVVHSAWAAGRVEGMTLGEVTVAPLPVGVPAAATAVPEQLADVADDAVLIVTLGHVNANRGLDALLDAVAADEVLRARCHVAIVGEHSATMGHLLGSHAERVGLGDRVHLTGRIDDGALAAILERATICVALRDPVLEAKSASLLTQMRASNPVLVLDHAHYAELADDCVVKVPLPGTADQIRAALRGVVDDPAAGAARGARARTFVAEQHTASAYADALAVAAGRALETRPLVATVAALAGRLDRAGLAGQPAAERVLADTIGELFGDA